MKTENITSPAAPATLTERELFDEFMKSSINEYHSGRITIRREVAPLIDTNGRYDFIEVDLRMSNTDEPSADLEQVEDELASVLEGVKLARRAFEKLKTERLIEPQGHRYRLAK